MAGVKLTKRVVDAAEPRARRYAVYDSAIPGFALRVYPTGKKVWTLEYRPGEGGRSTAVKRVTIGAAYDPSGKVADFTPDAARREAERLRAVVLTGGDPQGEKASRRKAMTMSELATAFLEDHVALKRKSATKDSYESVLNRAVLPTLGTRKAADIRQQDIAKLHRDKRASPSQANRIVAIVSSMFGFAERQGIIPKGTNPATHVEKFVEGKRERMLTADELLRLGAALRDAETIGVPWKLREGAKAKHRPKGEMRTVISPHAVAALRLLLFTGCRLREILHLKWNEVDFDRGVLILTEHKTSRRTGTKVVVLNAPAIQVLAAVERVGAYVIAGDTAGEKDEKPRSDLKRPWSLVTTAAGLSDLRIHDLRHNFASFGAGGGMGLPIIGKLLGHAQAATTQRYAHLADDPLRKASNTIGSALAAALGEPVKPDAGDDGDNVVPMKRGA